LGYIRKCETPDGRPKASVWKFQIRLARLQSAEPELQRVQSDPPAAPRDCVWMPSLRSARLSPRAELREE
jgi:hypothetical protein